MKFGGKIAGRLAAAAMTMAIGVSGLGGFSRQDEAASPPPKHLTVYGFYAAGTDESLTSLQHYPKAIGVFMPFWYSVQADGSLSSHVDSAVLQMVRSYKIPVMPLVNDGTGTQAFLSSRATLVDAARNIADMIHSGGYQGVNIDFEPPHTLLRTQLNEFMRDLRDYLPHADPITLDIMPNSGGAYDYAQLRPEVRQFILMSYDQHDNGTAPGPVAALPWVNNVISRALGSVPASQVSMGIPLYGYLWTAGTTTAATIPYSYTTPGMRAQQKWSALDQESYATYSQNGVNYVAWWESLQGMSQKIAVAQQDKLGGIALWRLGYQNDAVMQLLLSRIGAQR